MLRNLTRMVTVCGLLVAGYLGYRQGFAVVVAHVGRPATVPIVPSDPLPSRSHRESIELARAVFGPNHWTTAEKDSWAFYDEFRGYWMYFKKYERQRDGRRLVFSPYAVIWRARKGNNLNIAQGDRAFVDFDKPFDLGKPGDEPAKVVHAMIEGEVRLRDDKGTRANPGDDLTIGPMTYLEYDDTTRQITSDSDIELREGDLVANATGLLIQLRASEPVPGRKPAALGGFNGAESVLLRKNIRITVEDVGRTGIVPGGGKKAASAAADPAQPRPGELVADGPAQFDLPRPRPPEAPPAPADPVIAQFRRNVVVKQGDRTNPDQLNCDVLTLYLLPDPARAKPTAAPADPARPAEPAESTVAENTDTSAPLSGLALDRAEATGHAVWLQSPLQGLQAFGNELRYEKHAPARPDVIYFRGDGETRVEKTNIARAGPKAGQVESVDLIRTKDVTIFQAMTEGEPATVVARGPGRFETRPEKSAPLEVAAHWGDKLILHNVVNAAGEPRRRVELTGDPGLESRTQGTLEARDRVVAYLKPRAADPTAPAAAPAPTPATASASAVPARETLQIDWMEAVGDVRLNAVPDGTKSQGPRQLTARNRLDVVFAPLTPPAETPGQPAAPPPTPAAAAAPPAPDGPAVAGTAAPEKPPEPQPAILAEADQVWARVSLASARSQPELQEVHLRGGVSVHQDAPPGKEKGTDVHGDQVMMLSRGQGLAWLEIHGTPKDHARIASDGMLIEGVRLGLDQSTDFAWARGAGRLYEDGKPPKPAGNDQAKDEPEIKETALRLDEPTEPRGMDGPVEIRWTQEMQFYGRPSAQESPSGNAVALFLGGVRGRSRDATLSCGKMKAFLDAPVAFQRAPKDPNAPAAPKPKIVSVRCQKAVDLVHRRADPETAALVQKGRITGEDVGYNLTTGEFRVPGKGLAWLYKPKGQGDRGELATDTDRGAVRPIAARRPAAGDASKSAAPRVPALLELTRISFQRGVTGRIGDGTPRPDGPGGDAPFLAEFQGGVQVVNAPVRDETVDIDPDDGLPPGAMLMASEKLRVVRELPVRSRTADPDDDDEAEDQLFIDATGRPTALAPPKAIQGDRITYDSVKGLVYVYGDEREVSIVNQDGTGQPFSATRGRAVMYNRRTREFAFIDPRNALVIDPRSGIREKPVPEGLAEVKRPDPRKPLRRVPRNDKERRSFNGR